MSMPNPKKTAVRVQKVRLYPDVEMKQVLDELCDYRRYCWNEALALWNDMYEQSLILDDRKSRPSEYKVRNELVAEKQDWQYALSARVLQLSVSDLNKAFRNFFDKAQTDWGKPKFKSKKAPRQGFKTDRARIVNGKLLLDRPHESRHKKKWTAIPFKGAKSLEGDLKVVSVYRENGRYYASLPFEVDIRKKEKTGRCDAVDVNVGHLNHAGGVVSTIPKRLEMLYKRIRHYQRVLARKRTVNGKKAVRSRNYAKTRAKLQRDYARAANIQHDLMQKFTTELVSRNDAVVIEDLNVKKMQMSHVASKGMHRSMFGYFRQVLSYKCEWYGRRLIIADKFYPSTQRCSKCGHIKQKDERITLEGNSKHKTRHDEYICYECGAVMDRDENAVMNLLALA